MGDIFSQTGMWVLAVTLHHNNLKITQSFGTEMKMCDLCAQDVRAHERNVCMVNKKSFETRNSGFQVGKTSNTQH